MRLRHALSIGLIAGFCAMAAVGAACGGDSIEITLPTPTPLQGLVVHVAGEVVSPGVYTLLPTADRVADAVEAAGGFTDRADVDTVNLAAQLSDGQQIRVLAVGESPADPGDGAGTGSPININTASLAALQTLAGIGPIKAQAIIDYRESNGPFQRIEDILKVKGIGEKTFEAIRDQIAVR